MSSDRSMTITSGAALRPVVPTDFEQVSRFAKMAVMGGMFGGNPDDNKAIAQATMAILQGMECGIPPMQAVQQIAVINGRCVIWGDLIPALIWRAGHTISEGLEGEGDARVAWCEIMRHGPENPTGSNRIRRTFSVADAKKAGLWAKKGPWQEYPSRMLQMRARGFCARDAVPDVLRGLYVREELDEDRAENARDITPAVNLVPPPVPTEAERPLLPLDIGFNKWISELDMYLLECSSEDDLHEFWGQHIEYVSALGTKERAMADDIFEKHEKRIADATADNG